MYREPLLLEGPGLSDSKLLLQFWDVLTATTSVKTWILYVQPTIHGSLLPLLLCRRFSDLDTLFGVTPTIPRPSEKFVMHMSCGTPDRPSLLSERIFSMFSNMPLISYTNFATTIGA